MILCAHGATSPLWVAALVEVDADERVGTTEDEADAIVWRLSSLISCERLIKR
jgi:hypothetical protein